MSRLFEDTQATRVDERRARLEALRGQSVEHALPAVLRALADEDFRVRREAALVAASLVPREEAAAAIAQGLDERDDIALRNACAEALAEMGPAALPLVRSAMDRLDADGRKLCVDVCAKIGTTESVALLLEALADANINVTSAAAEALVIAKHLEPNARADVVFALVSTLAQGHSSLTSAALHSLAELDAKIPRLYLDDAARDPALSRAVARLRSRLEAPPAESSGDLSAIRMSPEQYARLATMVGERFGIVLPAHARARVERALRDRVALHHHVSFDAYLSFLSGEGDASRAEWETVAGRVTVNETYFCREPKQLRVFTDQIVPYLHARAATTRRLTVWSAGCASGEEAYTLAMLLSDQPLLAGWNTRVFATDISKGAIARAKRGFYGAPAVRFVDEGALGRHFEVAEDGYVVRPHLRAMCHFRVSNLLDANPMGLFGPFDAVFCKNVLFYLDEASRDVVLAGLHRALNSGGILCLGHSDSLGPRTTAFELVPLAEDLVYRKPFVHHFGSSLSTASPPRDSGNASPPSTDRR